MHLVRIGKEMNGRSHSGCSKFLQYSHDNGVTVLYVTNREFEVGEATRKNLRALGFPITEKVDVVKSLLIIGRVIKLVDEHF